MNDNMSPADLAAVVGNTDKNNGYPYPVYAGNGFGNSGFGGDGSWLWFILILALMGGWGNNGNGGFGGGFNNDYAWLSNGQKEIMQNTNDGFNTLQLANQLTGINSGVQNLSTQLCNCCADMNQTVNAGFANAETAANARQMANMQQGFNNQIATLQGFNGVTSQLADCCCENRLATERLNATILSENCADRAALSEGLRDVITNQTANTQAVLDKLCQLELDNVKAQVDAKNEKIGDLQREVLMKDLQASQIAQTAELRFSNNDAVDSLYNRLSNCPVPSTPVYGRTPIFTCGGGCGCGNTFGNTIV